MRTPATLAVLFLLGCQPPTPEEVATQTANDVDALVSGALETARSTNTWSSIDSTYSMGQPLGTVSSRPTVPQQATTGDSMRYLRYYAQKIFTQSNAEPGSNGTIYLVRGDIICSNPDRPGAALDPDCVRNVDAAQLRIRAGGNIDLALQVGPERLEPFILKLRGGKTIAYEVDLEKSQRAYLFLQTALGTARPEWTIEARGRYEMRLDRFGQSDYAVSLSVLDDIFFSITEKSGIRRTFSTERRSPLFSTRLDGARRTAVMTVDVGRTTYDGIGSDLFSYMLTGPLHAELSGLTSQLTFVDGAQQQSITGISLGQGTSLIQYAGQTVLSLDLNQTAGRRFDLVMRNTTSGTTAFDVNPSVQLAAGFTFSALPGYSHNEAFDNARYAMSWKPVDRGVSGEWSRATGGLPEQFKLLLGELSLESNRAVDVPRHFAQGSCVVPFKTSKYMPHPILDALETVACR